MILTHTRDEILYHAKIHPEQYSNTLGDDQIKELNSAIHYVCSTSVDLLADSDKFPEDWLFKHRWSKGKKNSTSALPNGEKIVFLTVGGRTSAVVPSVQKKTGPVSKDINGDDSSATQGESKRKRATKEESSTRVKEEEEEEEEEEEPKPKRAESKRQTKQSLKSEEEVKPEVSSVGRRRSTRTRK